MAKTKRKRRNKKDAGIETAVLLGAGYLAVKGLLGQTDRDEEGGF